jgi:hypothetical protein
MLGGPFPPLPDPGVLYRRVRRLVAQASLALHNQHLVSGVLLGQFTAPVGQRGAAQVYSLNLEYRCGISNALGPSRRTRSAAG